MSDKTHKTEQENKEFDIVLQQIIFKKEYRFEDKVPQHMSIEGVCRALVKNRECEEGVASLILTFLEKKEECLSLHEDFRLFVYNALRNDESLFQEWKENKRRFLNKKV